MVIPGVIGAEAHAVAARSDLLQVGRLQVPVVVQLDRVLLAGPLIGNAEGAGSTQRRRPLLCAQASTAAQNCWMTQGQTSNECAIWLQLNQRPSQTLGAWVAAAGLRRWGWEWGQLKMSCDGPMLHA